MQSSTIDLDNFINNDAVVKVTSAVNNFYLTSIKRKTGDEEEADVGNET